MRGVVVGVGIVVFLTLSMVFEAYADEEEYPPLSPPWVFEHWVWEDNENTGKALLKLLRGYEKHGIPVGAVMIDSPWSTEYNNFVFNTDSYPRPKKLIESLHSKDIKVLLWMTSMINRKTIDGPFEPKSSRLYSNAKRGKYLVNNGALYTWWKGKGAFIDYSNEDAVQWWHQQMDKAMDLGIDGWKVDAIDAYFPKKGKSQNANLTQTEFRSRYYSDMYDYSFSRNPNSVVLVRSVDRSLGTASQHFAPIPKSNATWVGDQRHTWQGLRLAVRNILSAAREGYSVIGSDIGGYNGPVKVGKELLIRWAQFGALTPLMENGGEGKHAPWLFDDETVKTYRYFVKLHMQLKPYWYSLMAEASRGGLPILRPFPKSILYQIGEDLLVFPITTNKAKSDFVFPEGEWIDYWNPRRRFSAGSVYREKVPLRKYPLFMRSGGVIPLQVIDEETGHGFVSGNPSLTFDVYPGASRSIDFFLPSSETVSVTTSSVGNQFVFRKDGFDEVTLVRVLFVESPTHIAVDGVEYSSVDSLEALSQTPESYFYDEQTLRLSVLLPANASTSLVVGD